LFLGQWQSCIDNNQISPHESTTRAFKKTYLFGDDKNVHCHFCLHSGGPATVRIGGVDR
jgi:hypothetical protein